MHARTRIFIAAAALVLFGALSSVAIAASPHFKHGGEPVCSISSSDGGLTQSVTCTATLAGLGNQDLLATTSVSGTAVYQCQNNGGNIAPGQNKVLVGPAISQTAIPADAIKNGNLTLTTNPAVLSAPETVSGEAAGCPNPNWTGVNPTVTVTNISLTIEQPVGTVIFSCSASNPNGLSGNVALSC